MQAEQIERVVDIDSTACPYCAGALHRIGEEVSERLDVVPVQFRVLVVRRLCHACCACGDAVVQAPAPARLIESDLPTDGLVAQVTRLQIRRSSAAVSTGPDLLPPGRQPGSLDAGRLGRARRVIRLVHERLLETLERSGKLFADETTAPGRGSTKTGQLWAYARDDRRSTEKRRAVRQERSRPVVEALEPWLREKLALLSRKSNLAESIRYALRRWAGPSLFVADGRFEIGSKTVELAIRSLTLGRKNALFAGSDGGGRALSVIASLVKTCKLVGVEPQAYLADVITRIVEGHPQRRLDELLPWAYPSTPKLQAVA